MGPIELPPYPSSTILVVEVGSGAHGTGIAGGEDHDEFAIFVESPLDVFGLTDGKRTKMQRTQPEGERSGPGDTDRTVFPLRKFLSLAGAGNPSILTAFWSPVLHQDERFGPWLRDLAPLFVARSIIPRYRGYMQSQALRLLGLKRANGHGKRAGARPELVSEYGYDTKYAMHCARLGFQCVELLTTGQLLLPIAGEPGDWLRAVRYGEVPFNEWWERTLELDAVVATLAEDDSIPPRVNAERIATESCDLHLEYWYSSDTVTY